MSSAQTDCPFDAAIYVPVHYDFSQIEYVAPFLEQFHGSKVFIYRWNGIRDKITDYYRDSVEYKNASLGVYEFSLKNIIKCILDEPAGKKIVFLLTTSMAYAFGPYQKQLLLDVRNELNIVAEQLDKDGDTTGDSLKKSMAAELRDKVWGVSVIGHCMYGCMSCKGNDHKVPVYYTRYFRQILPYTADHIRKQFNIQPNMNKPIPVLCAPSTGETCVLLHRLILDYLLKLEHEGHYKFIWKFHPAIYNISDYDESDEANRIEMENVKWIFKNFQVTREDEPCLLPFVDAFPVIFCDLHSSVPFISSYFAPKTIVCYWNDADYEVPAGRDPEFLQNLNVFQHLEELPAILAIDKLPAPKGDQRFFWDTYGKVDGNEVNRFAALANWPRKSNDIINTQSTPISSLLRQSITTISKIWLKLFAEAERKTEEEGGPEKAKEDYIKDCKMAIGLFANTKLLSPTITESICDKVNEHSSKSFIEKEFKVMSLNLWHGSEACLLNKQLAGNNSKFKANPDAPKSNPKDRYELLSLTAAIILRADADVVGLQECASPPQTFENKEVEIMEKGELANRVDNTKQLASILQEKSGQSWTAVEQGILTPGRGCRSPWSFVTRLPIVRQSPGKYGIEVQLNSTHNVWVFNTHLPYFPYQPYQLLRPMIPYEDSVPLNNSNEAVKSSQHSRGAETQKMIDDITKVSDNNSAVVVCGDFNEPSHLDWNNTTTVAGYHPMPVNWHSTNLMSEIGFHDAYRTIHPDPVIKPGWTWCAYNEEFADGHGNDEGWCVSDDGRRDKAERIDFVLFNKRLSVIDVKVLGNDKSPSGRRHDMDTVVDIPIANDQWTSDHHAVVATFRIQHS